MFFFIPFAPSILADFSMIVNAFLDTVCNLISIPCCRWSWPSTVSFLIAVKYTKLGFSDFSLEFIHICQLQAFPHLSITATPVICNNISLFLFHGFLFIVFDISTDMYSFWLGGRGANKALGRVLLEQNVNRQTCQREAVHCEEPLQWVSLSLYRDA